MQHHTLSRHSRTACRTPVVLLVFNRPALTRHMLERVRQMQPSVVLVVADGPRPGVATDQVNCDRVRSLVRRSLDWGPQVLFNHAERNMGCCDRVSSGLTWAFEHVEEAIILEDDCIPHASFFPFCEEMLDRWRDEPRVGTIAGNNVLPRAFPQSFSYYFSRYPQCWGWATWRRAWARFDINMTRWRELDESKWLSRQFADPEVAKYWTRIFRAAYRRAIDTWSFRWFLTSWLHELLAVTPRTNLVENIGFGAGATHTKQPDRECRPPVQGMEFPLVHPPRVEVDTRADDVTQYVRYGPRPRSWKETLNRMFRKLRRKLANPPQVASGTS